VDGEGDGEGEEDDEEAELPSPLLQGFLGFGGRIRNAFINPRDPTPSNTGREYLSGLFPELSRHVELRPLGPGGGAGAGLFARGMFGIAIGISSVDEAGNAIGTSSLRASGGLGYVYRISSVEIGGAIDFGLETFELDENATMASAKYTYARFGLAFRAYFLRERLRVDGDLGYRTALSVGGLVPFFGESASASAFDLAATGTYRLESGLTVGGRFGWAGWSLAFDGLRDDMIPGSITAIDGTDGGVYFLVMGGWTVD
jgi:hypothetical protein